MNSGRLTDWSDTEGKTIRAVVQHPRGRRGDSLDAVIVFDDDSWIGLCAMPDGSEMAHLDIGSPFNWDATYSASEYLHPDELLAAGLVNSAQRDFLLAQQAEELRAEKATKLASLRAEAEKLELEIRDSARGAA